MRTGKLVLNVFAPVFKPLFAWNYRVMMAGRGHCAGTSPLERETSSRTLSGAIIVETVFSCPAPAGF